VAARDIIHEAVRNALIMDKLTDYQTIIEDVFQDFLNIHREPLEKNGIETLPVLDGDHGRYLILRSGWHDKERIQHVLVFIRLVGGKVWVEEDWTDFDFVGRLLDEGIPQEDIVLAFHHPAMRPLTEFAPL
jgi:hypothetical protein